jgi:NAD+-dependent protein deacetylase sirtuin 4
MATLRTTIKSQSPLPAGAVSCVTTDATNTLATPPPPPRPQVSSLSDLGPAGEALLGFVAASERMVVLTGAGVSTASGLADYRSPHRPPYRPLQHGEFIGQLAVRRRYWARSFVGYPLMQQVAPNPAHHAIAALEGRGIVSHVITQVGRGGGGGWLALARAAYGWEADWVAPARDHRRMWSIRSAQFTVPPRPPPPAQNVDALHQRAGSERVLELHGTIHRVECLACGHTLPRGELQEAMEVKNRRWLDHFTALAHLRPDGDVELPADAYQSFTEPQCPHCRQGTLKPMVVFHGGNIPAHVSARALEVVAQADALLVLGTTCSTWSAFRLVRHAATTPRVSSLSGDGAGAGVQSAPPPVGRTPDGRPVAVINHGPTRADAFATPGLVIDAHISDVLTAVVNALLL